MIRYKCPKCGKMLESPSSLAGTVEECPACKAKVTVPTQAMEQQAARPSGTPQVVQPSQPSGDPAGGQSGAKQATSQLPMDESETDRKVDEMLRRWGADEFAGSLGPPAQPGGSGRRPRRQTGRFAWVVAGAAAAVMVGVLVALAAVFAWHKAEIAAATGDRQKLQDRLIRAESDKAALNSELASSTRSLQTMQAQIAQLHEDVAKETQRAAQAVQTAQEAQAAQAVAKTPDLAPQLAAKQAALDKQAGEIASLKAHIAAETSRWADANSRLQAAAMAVSTAEDEAAKLLKQREDALTAAKAATAAVEQLKARQAALWTDIERAYIAATAPRETGLRAIQASIVQSRLNERVALARKAARTDSTRRLLDRVEVVMARLEMLEVGSFEAEDACRSMVKRSELVRQLELALEAQGESPDVRGVLFEARLILGGVERVS